MKLARLLHALIDPSRAGARLAGPTYAAIDRGLLCAQRLEERRVLACDLADSNCGVDSLNDMGLIQPLTVSPIVIVPSGQTTTEGSPLVFSAATGRLIRIDDPDIGSNPLVIDITAFEASGRTSPFITLAFTSGLTSITGNGTNVLRLEGTLASVNSALSHLTFYTIDDGNFTFSIMASDLPNGESGSNSFQVIVANAPPQISASIKNGFEGSLIEGNVQIFDPGIADQVQITWAVSYGGTVIAQGAGPLVQFVASNDGTYKMSATAIDKDGAVSTASAEAFVSNVLPSYQLDAQFRDRVAHLSVVIKDPGAEHFTVIISWNSQSGASETHVIDQKTFEFSHEYTPEELASTSNLIIGVAIADDSLTFERQTVQFREAPLPDVDPPKFEAPPPAAPPERDLPERPQLNTTTPQVPTSDPGQVNAQGRADDAVVQLFVLRVVGPDGKESGNIVLPEEALENLPGFLSALGVPDGHYRVYLVTGEWERLFIDAHLRAGRLIDPRGDSQPGFDEPPASDSGSIALLPGKTPLAAAATTSAHDSGQHAPAAAESVPATPAEANQATTAAEEEADAQSAFSLTQFGGVVIAGATSMTLAAGRGSQPSRRNERFAARRFTKGARLARKLERLR